jgi:hypothetical protein
VKEQIGGTPPVAADILVFVEEERSILEFEEDM